MNHCLGCIEIKRDPPCWVEEPCEICCDCAFKSPEERQREMSSLRRALARAERSLRDRFAEAALVALGGSVDYDIVKYSETVSAGAFKIADAMMRARLPEVSDEA